MEQKVGKAPEAAVTASLQQADITSRIRDLLSSAPVMLFMKGTPESPRCGFSRKVSEIFELQPSGFHGK